MTVQTQMVQVMNFRTEANANAYNETQYMKRVGELRADAHKLTLKREQFAVLELIRAVCHEINIKDTCHAYVFKGQIYINHKNVPAPLLAARDLVGTGLTSDDWDRMGQLTLWKNSYSVMSVLKEEV